MIKKVILFALLSVFFGFIAASLAGRVETPSFLERGNILFQDNYTCKGIPLNNSCSHNFLEMAQEPFKIHISINILFWISLSAFILIFVYKVRASNRKILILVLLSLILAILIILYFGARKDKVIVEGEYKCSADSECTAISITCCGGANFPISKSSVEEYRKTLDLTRCENLDCMPPHPDNPIYKRESKCVQGFCKIVEK